MSSELELTAPIVASVVAFVMLLLHIFLQFNGSGDSITLFYDESNSFNFSYQYVVRLLYDAKSTSFDDVATTIFVEIEHSIRRIVKIPIGPATLNQVFVYKGHRCAKIFIRTCEKYRDVRSVLLYHNCSGSILVHSVELQDIDDSNSIISVVNNAVYGGGRASNMTSYPFGIETPTEIEGDIRPSRNVTIAEALYIFFATANLVYVLNSYVLGFFCSKKFCDLTKAFLVGFGGGVVGFIVFGILMLPFRFGIRTYFSKSMGRGSSKWTRIGYIAIVIIVGICGGVFSCEHSLSKAFSQINTDARVLSADRIWISSTIFSLFCVVLLIGLSIPFALYFKFIELMPDEELPKGPLNGRGGKPSKATIRKYKSDEARSMISSSYSSHHTNRRSAASTSSASSAGSAVQSNHQSSAHGASAVDSSTGGQYYRILAEQKNAVKSISQFYAREHPSTPKAHYKPPPTPPPPPPSPIRPYQKPFNPETRDKIMLAIKDSPRGASKADNPRGGASNADNKDKSKATVSVAGPESSVGENYYAAMANMAQIRSVSQYQKN